MKNDNAAILPALWSSDEVGSIVHGFSSDYDFVIRFNGGSEMDRTVCTNGKRYFHHLIPSIDFYNTRTKAFISSNVVVDLQEFYKELVQLEDSFPKVSERVYVDPDAFIVLPDHKEKYKTQTEITNAVYLDKFSGKGKRIKDWIKEKTLITSVLKDMGVNFIHAGSLKQTFFTSRLLFEGSQGLLSDVNIGNYPYVSSFDCSTAAISASGFDYVMPKKIYGVIKPYCSKSGEGAFPTELLDKDADNLRSIGNEYDVVGDKPRRVGWLDLPLLKYAADRSGITDIIVSRMNILNSFNKVRICYEYDKAPICGESLFDAKPKYLDTNGWRDPTDFLQIKAFIENIQFWAERKVSVVSCGIRKVDMKVL